MLPPRILVVEDDPDVRLTVEAVLRTGGLQVDVADRWMAAASRLRETRLYHLVIADALLGPDSGIAIADCALAKGIPALVITAYPERFGAELARHVSLSKPFRPSELLGAVRQQLSG